MGRRADSDEFYVLDLVDEIVGVPGSRQHRFEWLRGDWSERRQSYSYLPVDGYWASLGLVVEFAERQHSEAVRHFDKPDVLTISGVHRGIQRRLYDERRGTLIPANGLRLVTIPASAFSLRQKKIVRGRARDIEVVRQYLED